jgi:hypothetical protein
MDFQKLILVPFYKYKQLQQEQKGGPEHAGKSNISPTMSTIHDSSSGPKVHSNDNNLSQIPGESKQDTSNVTDQGQVRKETEKYKKRVSKITNQMPPGIPVEDTKKKLDKGEKLKRKFAWVHF